MKARRQKVFDYNASSVQFQSSFLFFPFSHGLIAQNEKDKNGRGSMRNKEKIKEHGCWLSQPNRKVRLSNAIDTTKLHSAIEQTTNNLNDKQQSTDSN
jgi:hypothetical protein